jgi:enterochelin esterase-like enzyme
MEIEIATKKDVPALMELRHKAFGPLCKALGIEEKPTTKNSIKEAYEVFDMCTTLKVKNNEGAIIGAVQGNITEDLLYIGNLMVLPEYQRRGIGKHLLREIQRMMPHKRAWLYTCQNVDTTYSFYQREGFSTFEKEQASSGLTWAYMEKLYDGQKSKIETVNIKSDILGKKMPVTVYVPGDDTYLMPVLYFMHGRSGNEKIMYDLDIKDVADRLIAEKRIQPMVIVCPRMDDALGMNQYEDYFFCEVAPLIESRYHPCHRYIGGISAGGYIAMNYAMRHPAMFKRVGGHMPAIEEDLDMDDLHYFGSKERWKKNNPIFMARECPVPPDVEFYLDAGDEDEGQFYLGCKELTKILKKRGYHVENHLNKGHHELAYIKSHLNEYLMFYAPNK